MDYIVRPYRPGEEAYVADAQRRVYSEEYHWGPSFIDYAVKITLEFAAQAKNEREEMWVADSGGKLIGCIMLCQSDESPDAGQLRLFLVEKEYRRFGIGRALTTALFQKAREAGYKQLILWTASPLTDAVRHYEKLGFHKVEEVENHDWSLDGETVFEVKMVLNLV